LLIDRASDGPALVIAPASVGFNTVIEIDSMGVSYQYLDGSTPAKKRKTIVEAFQDGHGDVFLISLKAGGTGLNLTAADYVIHMDPWWNPAVEDQATDRAHRIGQSRPVNVYRFISQGTVDAWGDGDFSGWR